MFSIPLVARAFAGLGIIACAACVNVAPRSDGAEVPLAFYTVTGEIALSRHEPRVAALEYAAASQNSTDAGLLHRAAEVSAQCLQPSLTAMEAARWIDLAPGSVDAHRAAAHAALDLFHIEQSTAQYRTVLMASSRGTEAELTALDSELAGADDVYGARRVVDNLAGFFPASPALLRLQAYTAMRADDPAAAVRSFTAMLSTAEGEARREVMQGLWRARILSGNVDAPLAESQALLQYEPSAANRLDHALLLLAAQQSAAARVELAALSKEPESAAAALHLLGLMDFQDGNLDDASTHFAALIVTGKFLDDAFYYLGVIAERHEDLERALRLYAQVQDGDNSVPALLHAAAILNAHGAAPAAEELLDSLVEDVPLRAPEILAARARIYADAGDLPRASTVLNQATLQYPDSVALRYATASLAEERGDTGAALAELKAVLKDRPNDPAALNAYGYTLADHHRHLKLARKLVEQAYAAAPKNAAILDSLGWVLFRQGHSEDALPYLNAAFADDRGGDIAAHLGEVLWQLGRRTDAERVWSEGGRTDSHNPLIKATRQRLRASN